MKMSRPRKPTKVKELDGNPGKRALPKREPKPAAASDIDPPDWVPEIARMVWWSHAEVLQRLGLFTEADRDCLAQYSVHMGDFIELTREIDRVGRTVEYQIAKDVVGVKANPAVSMRNKASELAAKYGGKLGLSPSDRAALSVDPPEEDEEAFLYGKK